VKIAVAFLFDHDSDYIKLFCVSCLEVSFVSIENVTTAAYISEVLPSLFAENDPQILNAFANGSVRNGPSVPHCFDEFVFAYQLTGILHQIFKHLIGLRSQMNRLTRMDQTAACPVKDEAVKETDCVVSSSHGDSKYVVGG
jgi:hypothetical protein